VSPLRIAKAHCAVDGNGDFTADGRQSEREIAQIYCQPRAYWRSLLFLEALPKGTFTSKELNLSEKSLVVVSKYLALTGQADISRAAKQLFHLVEQARREFRDAQDRAWSNRQIREKTPEDYDGREVVAWRKFCEAKQKFLRRYHRAVHSGIVRRATRKEQRICPDCGEEPLRPRRRKCDACCQTARRNSNRQAKLRFKRKQLTGVFPSREIPKIGRSAPTHRGSVREAINDMRVMFPAARIVAD